MAEDTNTNELVGSIYFYWSVEPSDNGKVQVINAYK